METTTFRNSNNNGTNSRNGNRHGQKTISYLERVYRKAIAESRNIRGNKHTKEIEIDIAYAINSIEQHGFTFFANHYIRDEVFHLQALVEKFKELSFKK